MDSALVHLACCVWHTGPRLSFGCFPPGTHTAPPPFLSEPVQWQMLCSPVDVLAVMCGQSLLCTSDGHGPTALWGGDSRVCVALTGEPLWSVMPSLPPLPLLEGSDAHLLPVGPLPPNTLSVPQQTWHSRVASGNQSPLRVCPSPA